MHKSFRLTQSVALAAAILLCGCTSPLYVESNFVAFHNLTESTASTATFTVLPWKKELTDSLEFANYARQVEQGLEQKGYKIAREGQPPTHAVFLLYGIDDGRVVTSTYSIPQYGISGYSGSTTTGTVSTFGSTSYLSATTRSQPIYGVTGYQSGASSETVFRRFVKLDIVELSDGSSSSKKVFEGQLKSEGSCGNIASVMPALLEVVFKEFPGESGKARTVDVPWNGSC